MVDDGHLYRYAADVVKVYDGDTITVNLDLGFGFVMHGQNIRLWGIDTPERRGAEKPLGDEVGRYVRAMLLDQRIVVRTELDKTGKFGRLLGTVFVEREGDWFCVNEHLVDTGRAELNTYGAKFTGWPTL